MRIIATRKTRSLYSPHRGLLIEAFEKTAIASHALLPILNWQQGFLFDTLRVLAHFILLKVPSFL